MLKRILLFFTLNLLVVLMITFFCNVFHIGPYLTAYGLDLKTLAVFCLLWGFTGAFISLALSRAMAKWMMGIQVVDPHTQDAELRRLLETVKKLAQSARVPMPEVGIYRSSEINAFATGPTRNRSLVAVSSGLFQRMSQEEIEGVLAHEIAHIANGDMVTMTLLQGVVNAFVMFLARVFAYAVSGMGRNSRENNANASPMSYMLFVYLFEVVFMILGSIVVAAYSRYREFRADAGGARLAGTHSMIAALQSLQALQNIHDPRAEKPAMAAFKISHSGKKGWLTLFASHPPLEERIARLQQRQ